MRGTIAIGTAAIAAALLLPSAALAGPDELKGGSVNLQLQGSKALKLSPSAVSLGITGGRVDPLNGAGAVLVAGGFKAKRGKHKAKVTLNSIDFGANGGPGNIRADVGKDSVGSFASLSGGSVARDGFGARLSGIQVVLTRAGARALNRAFSGKKGKGGKKATAAKARGVKAGLSLGTMTAVTVPQSVEVVPGSGSLTLTVDPMSPFVQTKLPAHCVSPLPINPGVTPIAPATSSGLLGNIYTFPVTGGAAAPDFSAGEIVTGGGQQITKNNGLLTPGACASTPPPAGTSVISTNFGVNFNQNFLMSDATLPTGPLPRANLADIDFSTGTRSFDPATNTLTINGAGVKLADLAAMVLNATLPTASGNPADDFKAGDALGTIVLTAKIR